MAKKADTTGCLKRYVPVAILRQGFVELPLSITSTGKSLLLSGCGRIKKITYSFASRGFGGSCKRDEKESLSAERKAGSDLMG